MTGATIDTHGMVKRMLAAGFTPEQAETVTEILRESREADLSQLVTKADLRAELAGLENRLPVRLGGTVAAGVAVMAAMVALF